MNWLESKFKLKENGTNLKTEIIAGITTFLTMSYIIIVNPAILSANGKGIPFSGALVATILVSSLSSILMGLMANLPYGLAPGMGINAFFAYTLVLGMGVDWRVGLGAVFISGIIFIILSLVKVRELIALSIPTSIKNGVAAGIGVFLALIGLKEASFIVPSPATMVKFGGFTPKVIIFLLGLLLVSYLISKRVKGALIIGIAFTSLLAYLNGRVWGSEIFVKLPQHFFSWPDFKSSFFKLDIKGALSLAMLSPIFTLLFTDMFDSISTFLGISQVANLVDEKGQPKNIREALLVDAISTTISGLFGTSSGTTYIESAAGVEEGGRTGLTAIVIGLLFLPFLFIAPLAKAIPFFATAPVLVVVGFYMIKSISNIDYLKVDEALPAFLALILIPFTYSITQGISWSFLFYTFLKLVTGKRKEIHPMLYILTILGMLAIILS